MTWSNIATIAAAKSDAVLDWLFYRKAERRRREIANLSAMLDVAAKAKSIGEKKLARDIVSGLERSLGESAARMQGYAAEDLPRDLPRLPGGRPQR